LLPLDSSLLRSRRSLLHLRHRASLCTGLGSRADAAASGATPTAAQPESLDLQRRQQTLQSQQQQLTSGKRIALASDDPTGAARAERAQAAIGRVEANQRALEASRNSMTLSEAALGNANDLLQQVRESMVAAGNASYSDSERQGLANKLKGIRSPRYF